MKTQEINRPFVESLFKDWNAVRAARIHTIINEEGMNSFDAMVHYDTFLAPIGTDRQKFAMIGLFFDTTPTTEEAAATFVEEVIMAYSLWGEQVMLNPTHTSLQSATLLQKVMDDEVRLIPPAPEQHLTIIDLRGPALDTDG